jgi:hypothetical protein
MMNRMGCQRILYRLMRPASLPVVGILLSPPSEAFAQAAAECQ